jgi:hypothetical protein
MKEFQRFHFSDGLGRKRGTGPTWNNEVQVLNAKTKVSSFRGGWEGGRASPEELNPGFECQNQVSLFRDWGGWGRASPEQRNPGFDGFSTDWRRSRRFFDDFSTVSRRLAGRSFGAEALSRLQRSGPDLNKIPLVRPRSLLHNPPHLSGLCPVPHLAEIRPGSQQIPMVWPRFTLHSHPAPVRPKPRPHPKIIWILQEIRLGSQQNLYDLAPLTPA